MRVMTTLSRVCECGVRLVDKQGSVYCPGCGKAHERDAPRANKAHFAVPLDYRSLPDEGESLHEGYHPSEVAEARRMLPTHDIRDDGSVHFHSASHRRKCYAESNRAFTRDESER